MSASQDPQATALPQPTRIGLSMNNKDDEVPLDEIARAISSALRGRLLDSRAEARVRRPTDDLEAYQLYLKGRQSWNRRTEQDLWEAMRAFEQALARDPAFALAHAGVASRRAAERLVFGRVSTGAADDLAKVTDIARSIVTRYGMSAELGHDFNGAALAFAVLGFAVLVAGVIAGHASRYRSYVFRASLVIAYCLEAIQQDHQRR